MKRAVAISLLTTALFTLVACNKPNPELEARLAKIEERLDAMEKRPAMPRPMMPPPQEKAYNVPTGSSPVLGNPSAPFSVVVFSDYQCPFCARTDDLFHSVVKDPDLKDKVNVVFKNFPLPFHDNARPAAKAALAAAEQGKFWEMSQKLYANQQNLTPDNFKKWAKEIGLDTAKFEKDLKANDGKYEAAIKADMELGTTSANVRGTPTILVGGWELRERSVDGIKNLLKEKKLM